MVVRLLSLTQPPSSYDLRGGWKQYQTVATHWPEFRERADEHGGLPKFVAREFDEVLRCGILEYGCLAIACARCGFERLVAFSCKRRGFCPSCLGRRMADTAAHLVEKVIPHVPTRQWVCSFPWRLRVLLGYERNLCAEVLGAFVEELTRSLRWRAKRLLGLKSVEDAHTGAITFVQRFDSALRLNVHSHVISLDGVYVEDEAGALTFEPLPEPTARSRAAVTMPLRRSPRSSPYSRPAPAPRPRARCCSAIARVNGRRVSSGRGRARRRARRRHRGVQHPREGGHPGRRSRPPREALQIPRAAADRAGAAHATGRWASALRHEEALA